MQTMTNEEVYDWLYAINPLLAGQMRSKSGMIAPHNLAPIQSPTSS